MEPARQMLPLPLGAFALLAPTDDLMIVLIVAWDIFSVGYLVLTWAAFRGREPSEIHAMVRVRQRLRWLVAQPEHTAQGAAFAALVAAVLVMPSAGQADTPTGLTLGAGAIAGVVAWLVLQAGFGMAYVSLHTEVGGMQFPETDELEMSDFAYFTLAVGTTFGTTDVTVTERRVRRQVATHSVLSFFFNTLVLASMVAVITQFV